MTPATGHQTVTVSVFGWSAGWKSVMELYRGLTTEVSVVDYRRASIFSRMSQLHQKMRRYCCPEEGQKTSQTVDHFYFRTVREGLMYRSSCHLYLFWVGWQLHWALHSILQPALERLCANLRCIKFPVSHCEPWVADHYARHLQCSLHHCGIFDPSFSHTFNGSPWAKRGFDIVSPQRCFFGLACSARIKLGAIVVSPCCLKSRRKVKKLALNNITTTIRKSKKAHFEITYKPDRV